jgi:hypothetical protein
MRELAIFARLGSYSGQTRYRSSSFPGDVYTDWYRKSRSIRSIRPGYALISASACSCAARATCLA